MRTIVMMGGDLATERSHGAEKSDVDLDPGEVGGDVAGMDDDEKRRTYAAARAIKDHFFAVAKPILFDGEPDRGVGNMVNPFYGRTQSGLFVEVYYGAVSEIWTPWGRWNFRTKGTSGTSREYTTVMDAFLARVATTVHEARRTTRIGEYGPIYAVVSVDGCGPIPAAMVDRSPDIGEWNAISYDEAMAEWKALTAAYDAEHGIEITKESSNAK